MFKLKYLTIVIILFFATFTTAITSQVKDNHKIKADGKIWNSVCPVRGDKISSKVPTAEYKGKIYGFCCKGCDSKFKKEPEKYLKNLSADGKKFIMKKSE